MADRQKIIRTPVLFCAIDRMFSPFDRAFRPVLGLERMLGPLRLVLPTFVPIRTVADSITWRPLAVAAAVRRVLEDPFVRDLLTVYSVEKRTPDERLAAAERLLKSFPSPVYRAKWRRVRAALNEAAEANGRELEEELQARALTVLFEAVQEAGNVGFSRWRRKLWAALDRGLTRHALEPAPRQDVLGERPTRSPPKPSQSFRIEQKLAHGNVVEVKVYAPGPQPPGEPIQTSGSAAYLDRALDPEALILLLGSERALEEAESRVVLLLNVLTSRERQVAQGIQAGKSLAEISRELNIKSGTARVTWRNARLKLVASLGEPELA